MSTSVWGDPLKEASSLHPPADQEDPLAELVRDCANNECEVRSVVASAWLREPDEPNNPIVNGLFDAGDRVAIVAQSKARKSFFALQIALCIATGTPFLGREVQRRRVALFNYEVSRRTYKQRLRRMAERLGIKPEALDGLILFNFDDVEPEGDPLALALESAVREGCQIAVMDPVYKCLGNENDQDEVKGAVRKMKNFTINSVTLIGVYHAAKGMIGDRQLIDRVSGSAVFVRDASTIVSLVAHATEPDHAVMDAIQRNYAEEPPVTIRFDNGAFMPTSVAPIEKNSRSAKAPRPVPPAEVDVCFTPTPLPYGQMVRLISQHCCVGTNRAKELLTDALTRKTVAANPRGRTTLYFKPNSDTVLCGLNQVRLT